MSDNPHADLCPHCGFDMDNGDIKDKLAARYPEKSKSEIKESAKNYGWTPDNRRRFSSVIGVECGRDRIEYFICPSCRNKVDHKR